MPQGTSAKFEVERVQKEFTNFKLNNLNELQANRQEFKNQIENCDYMFYTLNKHKEKYFNSIHSITPDRLNIIRNFTKIDDKGRFNRLFGFS